MKAFSVTYDIVTQESAEHGDTDENGYISENVSLRDAIYDFMATRTNACDGGDGLEVGDRWLTYRNGMEFETGAFETRYLHFPESITSASYNRIVRLLA